MAEDDPIKHVARWRPRPQSIRCVRPTGVIESYAVASGRRAWTALRKLVPADALELVGLAGDDIVGRWQAPAAAAALAMQALAVDEADDESEDDPPSAEAQTFRWLLREVRAIFNDQARASRDALEVVTGALKTQRDVFAQMPRVASTSDEDDDDGYGKVSGLLSNAVQLMAMQQRQAPAAPASSPAPPAEAPISPPRDSGG